MKYLFLILIGCAAKCEDVGNNYFVVVMPQENVQQRDVKDFKKPFQVYWNVPTMQCASKKIPFQNLYEKFGIIQNDNDRFIGNKIVIMYNEIDFPAIIYNKTSDKNILRNGGVPQSGNLEKHLIAFENELNKKIPDPYFDGIAIIDFESWRPVFLQNFGTLVAHRQHSIEIEKQLHNWWPKMWILREASLRFESASRRFMQTTLSMAKEMRPNALWGYYGFPHCFNMRGRDMTEKCVKDMDKENDSIYWLWAESTALFPSLYSSVSLSSSQLSSLIKGRVKETSRVRGRDTPIFPYFWFRYRDAGFFTEEDLEVVLTTLYQSNVSGFIIWGSSKDVNTVEKCTKLFNYVETILGPKIAKFTKQTKRSHSNYLANDEIYSNETSKVYVDLNTDEISSTESSTDYKSINTEESSQTLNNIKMSSTDNSITYKGYSNTEDSQTLNNYDSFVSYVEISTTETSVTDNEHTNSEDNPQTLNNVDLFSTSLETSTYSANIGQSSQTRNNNHMSLSTISGIYTSNNRASLQTSNNDIPKKDTLIVYNQYLDTKENELTLNNDNIIFPSESSTNNVVNIGTLNSDVSLSAISTIHMSDIGESTQNTNDIPKQDTPILYNHYSDNKENLQTVNDVDLLFLLEPTTNNVDSYISTVTVNNDEISSISTSNLYNEYIKTRESKEVLNNKEISSKGSFAIYNNFVHEDQSTESLNNIKYSKAMSPPSNELSSTDKTTDILIDSEIITEKNEFESTFAILNYNNVLLNSSEDRLDYLITVENSTDIKTIMHPVYIESTNVDDDYLIIVKKPNNKQNLKDNIKDIESETVYYTIETGNNDKTVTKSEDLSEMLNYLDVDITDIDKKVENKNDQDLASVEDESFHNIKYLNVNEDKFDYLILVDNFTNTETFNQSEHTNITNFDNDYLIIVSDLSNETNEKDIFLDKKLKDLYSTTQIEADIIRGGNNDNLAETMKDIDPVVAYITKTVKNMKLQDSSSPGDKSLDNNKPLNSNEDGYDYFIKTYKLRDKETDKQYEFTESTNTDNDQQNVLENIEHNKLEKHSSTPLIEANVRKDAEYYDLSEMEEDLDY